MKDSRHHDMLSFSAHSHWSLKKQRFPIAAPLAAVRKAVACTVRAAALALVVAAGLPLAATAQTANLLFSSGYEDATALSAPYGCSGSTCSQDIVGTDFTTGFMWPPNFWGGDGRFQFRIHTPVPSVPYPIVREETVGIYMLNQIQSVTGHDGNQTRAVYSEIKQKWGPKTQDTYILLPAFEGGDLYISYWLKFQPNLLETLTPQTWRDFFLWKTAGDYRVSVQLATWDDGCNGDKPNGPLFWEIRGDNLADGGLPPEEFWKVQNCAVPVPVDQWFKFEVFWHRSSAVDGRVWMAVNGRVIVDQHGPNIGQNSAPINRIYVTSLFSGTLLYPIYQWVDDVQIWDGFPPTAAPH